MPEAASEFRSNLFDEPCNQFMGHLEREGNIRIVFSGKFGIGKTYFLDHFFKKETQEQRLKSRKQQYRAFHIYPVNYSISSTEDIYKYLRYDVLCSMLLNGVNIEESDYKLIDTYPIFLDRNIYSFLKSMIRFIPKVGKDLEEILEIILKLQREFVKQGKELTKSEGDKAVEFLDSIKRAEGSIYEDDLISHIIVKVLERVKAESGLENILIIDDLDRIDPEHLFRILNVFAAHLGPLGERLNKLGFDKVIVVCDVNNLRSIFRSKYGVNADFNGYIDKFYSFEVYHLDNKAALSKISEEAFRNVDFGVQGTEASRYMTLFFREETLAIEILQHLISYGLINLRSLMGIIRHKIMLNPHQTIELPGEIRLTVHKYSILFGFSILSAIVGGYDNLKEIIERIPTTGWKISRKDFYCNQLLYFSNYHELLDQAKTGKILLDGTLLICPSLASVDHDFARINVVGASGGIVETNQYKYSSREFIILLKDFIDIMGATNAIGR